MATYFLGQPEPDEGEVLDAEECDECGLPHDECECTDPASPGLFGWDY